MFGPTNGALGVAHLYDANWQECLVCKYNYAFLYVNDVQYLYHMDSNNRSVLVAHEVGHSLGLNDHGWPDYYYAGLMNSPWWEVELDQYGNYWNVFGPCKYYGVACDGWPTSAEAATADNICQ